MAKQYPTLERVRSLLRYDPETGKLFWRENRSHNARAGQEAGGPHSEGYRQVHIEGRITLTHHIIWLYFHPTNHGPAFFLENPKLEIDHVNGVRDDNRLENLRAVTRTENRRNSKKRIDNTSGVVGVCWSSYYMKWHSRIYLAGKGIYLGRFTNFEDAAAARKAAEKKYGYHPNHGRD